MYRDLLEQARLLATHDPKRPKQASLRRAISTAYYGLFHYLVEKSCDQLVGAGAAYDAQRRALARAFAHGTMKDACRTFAGGTYPGVIKRSLGAVTPPSAIMNIAQVFVDAQEKRHLADYDLTENFVRADVVGDIAAIEATIKSFESLPQSPDRAFFLVSIMCWKTMIARSG